MRLRGEFPANCKKFPVNPRISGKYGVETGSMGTASTANQSRLPLRIPAGRTNRAVPRHSRGPVSVSIHGMQTFDADIGSCLLGLFSTHGFAVAARRGALARITFVAIANVTHPVVGFSCNRRRERGRLE